MPISISVQENKRTQITRGDASRQEQTEDKKPDTNSYITLILMLAAIHDYIWMK
jgi:hypothetical protein